MPLEAIACTGCGSTDVQEVKPGTYFCNHCETVFKHVDPSRLNVSHTPGFCECGSGQPVTAQCQVCRSTALCEDCDLGRTYTRRYHRGFVIQTVGWGYVLKATCFGNLKYTYDSEVIERRLTELEPEASSADQLVIHGKKLLTYLRMSTRSRSLEHVCVPCACGAVPEVAERIANGTDCVWFDCDLPGERCLGCDRTVCPQHCINLRGTQTNGTKNWFGKSKYTRKASVEAVRSKLSGSKRGASNPRGVSSSPLAWVIEPPPTCIECLNKVYNSLYKVCGNPETQAEPISEAAYEDEPYFASALVVKAGEKRGRRAQVRENERVVLEAKRRWKELSDYAERLVASGAFRGDPASEWTLVDDRASTAAAAAPIVLGL